MTSELYCAICDYPINEEPNTREIWVDPDAVANNSISELTPVSICDDPACMDIVKEAMAEAGRRKVDR